DCWLSDRGARHREAERGASARSVAFGGDRATVRLYYVLADGQAQACAAAGARGVRLVKALEDTDQFVRGDANAGVRHGDFDERIVRASRDRNQTARRCELHRVREQITEHLRDLPR